MIEIMKPYRLSAAIALALIIWTTTASAQSTTIDEKKGLPGLNTDRPNYQVMVIPFEPKLYISEIDQRVNAETQMTFQEIRSDFRGALDLLLVAELKKRFKVLSVLKDTTVVHNDIKLVYESIGYDYLPLPEGGKDDNKKAAVKEDRVKSTTGQAKTKNNATIQDGQLVVTTNDQKRYMNTKVLNPKLLSDLHRKYGINYFVFVNELDLKYDMANRSKGMASGNVNRLATVHYSVYDASGKLLAGGVATKDFSGEMNEPKKIKATCFIPIAQYIAAQVGDKPTTAVPKQQQK